MRPKIQLSLWSWKAKIEKGNVKPTATQFSKKMQTQGKEVTYDPLV